MFVETDDLGPCKELKGDDTDKPTLTLYFPVTKTVDNVDNDNWINCGPVSCNIILSDTNKTGISLTGTVRMIEPTVDVTGTQNGPIHLLNKVFGRDGAWHGDDWGMSCGGDYFPISRSPGVKFTSANLSGTDGKCCWAQVLTSSCAYKQADGYPTRIISNWKDALDNSFPYGSRSRIGPEGDVRGDTTTDSPQVGWYREVAFGKNFNATMYYMWKPKGAKSIWVPLKKFDWFWYGDAYWDSGNNGYLFGRQYPTGVLELKPKRPTGEVNWTDRATNK